MLRSALWYASVGMAGWEIDWGSGSVRRPDK